jgi:hypothetical protein
VENTKWTRVGTGNLTQDGLNKKHCGLTKEGITLYNKIMEKVEANCNALWAQNMEDKVMETMRETSTKMKNGGTFIAVRRGSMIMIAMKKMVTMRWMQRMILAQCSSEAAKTKLGHILLGQYLRIFFNYYMVFMCR